MNGGARILVVDLGSVLFDFDPAPRLERLAERTGASIEELNAKLFESGFETRCEAGEYTAAQIRDEVEARTGFTGDEQALSNLWTSAFKLNEAVLDTLRETGLPLAIFSNNGPLFADHFDRTFPEAAVWFRHRYFACRLGARKPTPAAYEQVERSLKNQLDAAPGDLCLIDDNPANTTQATARGWHAHTYTDPQTLRATIAQTWLHQHEPPR